MRPFLLLLPLLLSVTGCAVIVDDPIQLIPIISTPDGAQVVITDNRGREVFKGTTPAEAILEKSDGSYFGGKDFVVTISKAGYASRTLRLRSSSTGWYWMGNFMVGGFIGPIGSLAGWLVVDPLNGHMYQLKPRQVAVTLAANPATGSGVAADDRLAIITLDEVPASLRDSLVPLN